MQFVLLIFFLTHLITLIADNEELGSWFKQSMAKNKDNIMEPENKQGTMYRWKNEKEKLISDYKKFLQRDIKGNIKPQRESETRSSIVSFYYYDETDQEIDKIVDFYIYVYKNDIDKFLRISAFKILVNIAFNNNQAAIGYIRSQANNQNLSEINRLQFYIVNLALIEEEQKLDYLSDLIDKAQSIETINIKYSSPIEQVIVGSLSKYYIPKRYQKGYGYKSVLPILKKLIYSRSVTVQKSACFQYYYHTNKKEMRKIFSECWAKIQDKSIPRIEFLDALYGLQALYGLSKRNYANHKIGFKEIHSYFVRMGGRKPIKNGFEYIELSDENRIKKEEKQYFQQRMKRMRLP